MHDRIKNRMVFVAVILAGMTIGLAAPVHGASAARAMTMEYLDPFDLSVTIYHMSSRTDGISGALPVAAGNAIQPGGSVTAAPSVTVSEVAPMPTTGSLSISAPIEVVTVSDVLSLAEGTEEMMSSAAGVVRVRVMVRIPFMPVLRSPCTPSV